MIGKEQSIGIITNAPVDIIVPIQSPFLCQLGLTQDICNTMSEREFQKLFLRVQDRWEKIAPGGCGINIGSWLSAFKTPCRVALTLGQGPYSEYVVQNLRKLGVSFCEIRCNADHPKVLVFVEQDGIRTFADYISDHFDISDESINFALESEHVVIDGYILKSRKLRNKIVQILKNYTGNIIFCPGDVSVIQEYTKQCGELLNISKGVVCNQSEAGEILKRIYGIESSYESLIDILLKNDRFGAVTKDSAGVTSFSGSEICNLKAHSFNIVSTNGAGDAFVGGFLKGLLSKRNLNESTRLGMACAKRIIQSQEAQPNIGLNIEEIENDSNFEIDYGLQLPR